MGSSDLLGAGVHMSTALAWFLAGIFVGTFVGIGLTVFTFWRILRALVRFAVLAKSVGKVGPTV